MLPPLRIHRRDEPHDFGEAGSFPGGAGLADEATELVGEVATRTDRRIRCAPEQVAEEYQKLREQRSGVRLGLRLDRLDDLARQSEEGRVREGLRPLRKLNRP